MKRLIALNVVFGIGLVVLIARFPRWTCSFDYLEIAPHMHVALRSAITPESRAKSYGRNVTIETSARLSRQETFLRVPRWKQEFMEFLYCNPWIRHHHRRRHYQRRSS